MSDSNAIVDSGRSFLSAASGGAWAGQQLLAALNAGKQISPQVLRTATTLRKDEWIHFDEQLVEEASIRLVGVADLMAHGLVSPVANAMGRMMYEYERVTDMEPATVSMDGTSRGLNDRQEFQLGSLPLPITHKDFFINLRTLEASRNRGESLDVTQVRTSGRLVAEKHELTLFQGGNIYGGSTIYGYTNHPDRNIASFGTNGQWAAAAKTGENILADLLTLIAALEADRMYGPYIAYVPRDANTKLDNDFKANSDKTTRARLLEVDGLLAVRVADQLPTANVLLVQMTSDVVQWVQGEPIQTIQWDVSGGFLINFKAFSIAVPLIRADAAGRSGVVHMS